MRNSLPLLSRTPAASIGRSRSPGPTYATPPQQTIPTIRLTTATPSVAGSADTSIASVQTVLAPRPVGEARKKLVPKKSKMSLLSVGSKSKGKGSDISDVARRVGVNSSTGRSFDIYVDPTDDPDIGEIVMVKKKKSRAALDGMSWSGALGDVTNVNPDMKKAEQPAAQKPATLKVKKEEKEKWWTIGRSRKDSKEKTKEKENNASVKVKTARKYHILLLFLAPTQVIL